jgi:acyl transferase domain-containing protein
MDASYWGRNLRETVRFAPAISRLLSDGHGAFLELGPHPVLSHSIAACAPLGRAVVALPSLRRQQPERATLLASLGGLYARGLEPDWGVLFPEGGRVVSLPSYVWKKDRFPVPGYSDARIGRAAAPGTPSAEAGHPLLGVRRPTALSQVIYESAISENTPAFLAEHRLGDVAVFPAAAHVEIAHAAAAETLGPGPVTIENLALEEMLALPAGERRVLQVIVERRGEDAAEFRVCTRSGDDPWRTHAQGAVRRGAPADGAAVEIDAALARCSTRWAGEAFYSAIADIGPTFGPRFRGVQWVALGSGEAVAEVRAPQFVEAEAAAYGFHPALLDACLQTMAAALGRFEELREKGEVYLPLGVEQVVLRGAPGSALRVHAHVRSSLGAAGLCDLRIVNENGAAVADLGGVRVQRASRAAVLRAVRPAGADWLHELVWRKAARSAPAATAPTGS